jgi:hypothetical protein
MRGIVEMVNQCVMWRVVSNDNSPTPSALLRCCPTLRSAVCAYRCLRLAQVFEIIEQLLTASAIIIRRSPVRIREEPPNTAHCSCSSGLFCCLKHTRRHSQRTFKHPAWALLYCEAEGICSYQVFNRGFKPELIFFTKLTNSDLACFGAIIQYTLLASRQNRGNSIALRCRVASYTNAHYTQF